MKTLLATAAVLAVITTSAAARDKPFVPGTGESGCLAADPNGTPLNVRRTPNGTIVGALQNDTTVYVMEIVLVNGKKWARMVPEKGDARLGRGHGWVFFNHLDCDAYIAPGGALR